jgi:hypothetical protein
MDHYLRHRAQNADVTSATPDITKRQPLTTGPKS